MTVIRDPNDELPPCAPELPFVLSAVIAAPPAPPVPIVTVSVELRSDGRKTKSETPPAAPEPPPPRNEPAAPRRPEPPPEPAPTTCPNTRIGFDGFVHVPLDVNS